MQNQPLISIIIPIYNMENYIDFCFKSILNQTLQDIEIICVDDGSTDKSLEILKEYAKKDSRIKILTQQNSGAGKARNKGILESTGEFISFIDSDDYYPSKDTLKHMYEAAKNNNALICGGSLFELRGKKIDISSKKYDKNYLFHRDGFINYIDYQFEYGYTRFIYNREFLLKNNLSFPDYLRFQDPPFFVKTMILAKRFYALKEPTYIYRVSHKNIKWTLKKAEDLIRGLTDILNLSIENHLDKLHCKCAKRLHNEILINDAFSLLPENDKLLLNMLNSVNLDIVHKFDPNYILPKYNNVNIKNKTI